MYILVIKPWKYWTSYNMTLVVSAGRDSDGEGGWRPRTILMVREEGGSPCIHIIHTFSKKNIRVYSASNGIFKLMAEAKRIRFIVVNSEEKDKQEIKRPSQNHKQQQEHLTRLKK